MKILSFENVSHFCAYLGEKSLFCQTQFQTVPAVRKTSSGGEEERRRRGGKKERRERAEKEGRKREK